MASCGPHVELTVTPALRITRCPCGTHHVSFRKRGISVSMSEGEYAELVQAIGPQPKPGEVRVIGSTVIN